MPPKVILNKCTGCRTCETICPGDLMVVGTDQKAYCRDLRDCWDCMACTKSCPVGAIETRVPYQLGYHQAKLIPKMEKNQVIWTCVDINGKEDTFIVKNNNKA